MSNIIQMERMTDFLSVRVSKYIQENPIEFNYSGDFKFRIVVCNHSFNINCKTMAVILDSLYDEDSDELTFKILSVISVREVVQLIREKSKGRKVTDECIRRAVQVVAVNSIDALEEYIDKSLKRGE